LIAPQNDVDGLAAIALGDYVDWAYIAKEGEIPPHDGLFRRIGSIGPFPVRRDLLDQANVTRVLSCVPLHQEGLTLVSQSPPVYAYRNDTALPRAFWACAATDIGRDAVVRHLVDARYDDHRVLRARYSINVRWAPHTSSAERVRVEQRRHLLNGVQRDASTWRYVVGDTSRANGLALIAEPTVEDTTGLDRSSGAPEPHKDSGVVAGPDTPGLLISGSCPQRGRVQLQVADRPDGRVRLLVEAQAQGWVFLSEPYYVERRAYVDGREVRASRANVAFTAVPVPPGYHRLELRYVPTSFQAGSAITALTALAWGVGLFFVRRRRSIRSVPL
jgi:hypothetical protein